MKHYSYLFSFLGLFLPTLLCAQTPERSKELQECMEVSEPIIDLALWDAGVEDNDTVRVYLNNEVVLDSFRLSKAKQHISLKLKPGQNELMLYAINLGDIPDNTSAFSINGSSRKSLKSGLKVSGTMNLIFQQPAPGVTAISCPENIRRVSNDDDEAKAIRSNPSMALPSYRFLEQGIRWDASQPSRKVDIQDCYNSSMQEVELEFWDCGVEDNDTISLMLNGSWILKNHRLTKSANSIKIQLNQGENLLILYAHNLGDIPKNTAAIAIKNSHARNEVGKMISDEQTCGAIRISYGFTDENGIPIPPCLDENTVDSTDEPEMVYLSQQKPQQNTQPGNPPTYKPGPPATRQPNPPTRRRRPVPPVVTPAPTYPTPQPTPPSDGGTPPQGGRQPGDNPGNNDRNKPTPNY